MKDYIFYVRITNRQGGEWYNTGETYGILNIGNRMNDSKHHSFYPSTDKSYWINASACYIISKEDYDISKSVELNGRYTKEELELIIKEL